MKDETIKKNNHFYSKFHVMKWYNNGGKLYDKDTCSSRKIDLRKDFTKNYYYSEKKHNNELEDRIGNFESYIGEIIKRVDNAKGSVHLTGKEYELLKLYCVLCADRHHFSTKVIKSDKSGVYQDNNYIHGVHCVKNKEEALEMTKLIIEEFERLKQMDKIQATIFSPIVSFYPCDLTACLHLEILKRDKPDVMISNRCCLTEITLDSDYLYTYVPISPYTVLLLIKTKYYLDWQTFLYTKKRFRKKYGIGISDPYISEVFNEHEDLLFSSAFLIRSNVHIHETYLQQERTHDVFLKIKEMPISIVMQMNSMLCEDGDIILYCDDFALEFALKNKMPYREITVHY